MNTTASKNNPLKIVVLLSGRGSNFKAILEHVKGCDLAAHFSLVLSDKKNAAGLDIAKAAGIPTKVVPREAKSQSGQEFNEKLRYAVLEQNPDLIVLAGYMRVLSRDFISSFPDKIINIHPSLLPSFRGLHAQRQAIEAGVRFSGCTVHCVEEDVDAGPIIAQAVVPVLPGDSDETLSNRILKVEHLLYPRVVELYCRQRIKLVSNGSRKRIELEQPDMLCHGDEAIVNLL